MHNISLQDFKIVTADKVRYADTDRQGHVNNAVFSTFLETGRVEILYDPANHLVGSHTEFVIAELVLDYVGEITWPGTVDIGTKAASVGRSSLHLEQGLFQAGRCKATAKTTIVLIDRESRRSVAFDESARMFLASIA